MALACFFSFALAAGLGWLLSGQLGRFGFLDQPNARSSHKRLTPRGGGLAFIGATLLVMPLVPAADLKSGAALLWIPLPLALVGLLDDRLGLPVRLRLLVQLLTALTLALTAGWTLPAAAVVAVVAAGVINAINFMDGLDGLVASCMAVALGAAALKMAEPWPLCPLVAALLGFLVWNWSPAKVFMGDVGSTFLGAVFAGVVLQSPSWPEAVGLLLVTTPLLGDAGICVPRRLLARQRIWQAHRLHLFQRLHQAGWSHARVSCLYIAATTVLAIALLIGGWRAVLPMALVELLVGVWLDQRIALPFAVASTSLEEQSRCSCDPSPTDC
jgi:Fuc2NAc and GlcNAc transferase